MRGNTI